MKPRRDITLGEMQDECKTRIKCCTGCPYKEVCGEIPKLLDLTDPPRFTEAQMALLEALWINGIETICTFDGSITAKDKRGNQLQFADVIGMKEYDHIDLAELFKGNDWEGED